LLDPPFIIKAVQQVDTKTLSWTITVDNSANASDLATEIHDPLPAGMVFVSGTTTCQPFGASSVSSCGYDAPNNRILAQATLASDVGATSLSTAPNRLVISFQAQYVAAPVPVTNIARACWDTNNDPTAISACTQFVSAQASYGSAAIPVPTGALLRWILFLLLGGTGGWMAHRRRLRERAQ
jgi:uncharacterized repeat protein (TIGR01451 family)